MFSLLDVEQMEDPFISHRIILLGLNMESAFPHFVREFTILMAIPFLCYIRINLHS